MFFNYLCNIFAVNRTYFQWVATPYAIKYPISTMRTIIILSFVYIFCSCSRLLAPPSASIETLSVKADLSKSEKLALRLHQTGDSKLSCDELFETSEQKQNPLKLWSKIKFLEKCENHQNELNALFEKRTELPKWLHEDLYKLITSKSNNTSYRVEAHVLITKFLKTKKEKEKNLKLAISIAEKNKLSAEMAFNKLVEISPRYAKEVTKDNTFKIARDHERNRNFKSARKLYKKIIRSKESTLEEKVKAWDRLRFSYKLSRDKESYRQSTRKLVLFLRKFKNDDYANEMNAKYSNILARIYWTQGNYTRARRVIRDVLALKGIPLKHKIDSHYHFGGIYEDLRKYSNSIYHYKKAYELIQKLEEQHKHEESILWNIGWHFYKRKKYQEAITWLSKYETKDGDTPEYRFLFWQAKAQKKLGNNEKYLELLNKLRKEDNLGYYGQIAYMNGPSLKPLNNSIIDHDFKNDPLSWSIYLDNYHLTQKILDSMSEIDLIEFYHGRYYDKLIFKYFSLDVEKRKEYIEKSALYAYPLAFKKDFITSNLSKRVPTELLMAIARQESAFNRYARSPADAFGLLQLIPVRAKELSKRFRIPYKNFYDLYEPKTNISLSSKLLDKLMRRQRGNFIHFVASYNAGETPVRRWKKANRRLNDLEFIEEIPYSETRKYVKLVTRNILVYKRLLSNKEFKITDKFFRGEYK